eukprot:4652694-Amphidinium_carterae.1
MLGVLAQLHNAEGFDSKGSETALKSMEKRSRETFLKNPKRLIDFVHFLFLSRRVSFRARCLKLGCLERILSQCETAVHRSSALTLRA